jgi:molybdate transport system regulatory protein
MNSLRGNITKVEVSGNMSLVSIRVGKLEFKSIVIETPNTVDYLIEGGEIMLLFKETEVIIGKGENLNISLRNKMPGKVIELEIGALLAKLIIETEVGPVISLITANAVENLEINLGSAVVAMVKTNEILLSAC